MAGASYPWIDRASQDWGTVVISATLILPSSGLSSSTTVTALKQCARLTPESNLSTSATGRTIPSDLTVGDGIINQATINNAGSLSIRRDGAPATVPSSGCGIFSNGPGSCITKARATISDKSLPCP